MTKAEEDMAKDWQKKCDRMMATAAQQHKRQVSNLKDEKEELARRISDLEKKVILCSLLRQNSWVKLLAMKF